MLSFYFATITFRFFYHFCPLKHLHMRSILLSTLLLFIISNSFAQSKLFKIGYKLDMSKLAESDADSEDGGLSVEILKGLAEAFASDDTPQIQAWVNKEHIRVETKIITDQTQITNKTTGESFLVYPETESYSETEAATDKLLAEEFEGEVVAIDASEFPIRFVDGRTKVIGGYTCKLAILTVDLGEYAEMMAETDETPEIEIWYTEEIPPLYWGEYNYLKQLPGAALSIYTFGIGIAASQVEEVPFDASLFEIPEGYSLVSGYDMGEMEDIDLGEGLFSYTDSTSQLMGLRDAEYNIISEARFSFINPFHGEYAVAYTEEATYGVIDKKGNTVIPFVWSYLVFDPETNYLLFSDGENMGYMDINQKIIIPAKYSFLNYFTDGYAVFQEGELHGVMDIKGNIVVPAKYEQITEYANGTAVLYENERYVLLDAKSGKTSKGNYEYLTNANAAGLFLAIQDGKYGYIDKNEKAIIPFKFVYATPFTDGVASIYESDEGDLKYMNPKGEYVAEPATEEQD